VANSKDNLCPVLRESTALSNAVKHLAAFDPSTVGVTTGTGCEAELAFAPPPLTPSHFTVFFLT